MSEPLLAEQLRDALEHLNDTGYLMTHPLAGQIANLSGDDVTACGMRLRSLLLDLIESLKPAPDAPDWAPERRRYIILYNRYVLRQRMWEIEIKLALSERQVRREHSAAMDLLTTLLTAHLGNPAHGGPLPETMESMAGDASMLQEAIQRLIPAPSVFSVAELLAEVTALLSQADPACANALVYQVQPPDVEVYTDRGILAQLLMKLLQVLFARAPGAPPASARLEVTTTKNLVCLTLFCPGMPLPLEDEPLQLVRWLAQSLHSELMAPGEDHEGREGEWSLILPGTGTLRRVLVIDDEPASAELFRDYLSGREYQVFAETRAEEAVHRIEKVQPNVIVLDVMMPAMGGWEVLQHLRHGSQLPQPLRDIPVIVYSVLDDKELALALGATRFFRKPILRQQLIQALDELCARCGPRG